MFQAATIFWESVTKYSNKVHLLQLQYIACQQMDVNRVYIHSNLERIFIRKYYTNVLMYSLRNIYGHLTMCQLSGKINVKYVARFEILLTDIKLLPRLLFFACSGHPARHARSGLQRDPNSDPAGHRLVFLEGPSEFHPHANRGQSTEAQAHFCC